MKALFTRGSLLLHPASICALRLLQPVHLLLQPTHLLLEPAHLVDEFGVRDLQSREVWRVVRVELVVQPGVLTV